MKPLAAITLNDVDYFLFYLIEQDIGFNITYLKQPIHSDDIMLAANEKRVEYKKISYFDKGDGLYGVLYQKENRDDPSQTDILIFPVTSNRTISHQQHLKQLVSDFRPQDGYSLTPKDNARLLLHDAMACWRVGQKKYFKEAISIADHVLRLDPTITKALNCKGASQSALGDHAGAIQSYLQAIKTDYRCVRPWTNLGNRFSRFGMTDRALFAYRIGVDRPPFWDGDDKIQASAARHLRGYSNNPADTEILLQSRNEELDQLFGKVHRARGGTISREASKKAEYGRRGDWRRALREFQQAADSNPKDLSAKNNVAHALNQLGFYEDALKLCDSILNDDSNFFVTQLTRVDSLMLLKRNNDALNDLSVITVKDPDNAAALYFTALLEDRMNLPEIAVDSFESFLSCSPEDCDRQQKYASRRIEELCYFKPDIIQTKPTSIDGIRKKRYHHMGELLDCFQLETSKSESGTYYDGVQAYTAGCFELAEQLFETEIKDNPTSVHARNALALIKLTSGTPKSIQEALDCCTWVLQQDRDNADARVIKAEALLQEMLLRGVDLDPAHPVYSNVLTLYNDSAMIDARHPGILYWKALTEDAFGWAGKANRSFRQFVVVASEDFADHLQYARSRLHHLEFWKQHRGREAGKE